VVSGEHELAEGPETRKHMKRRTPGTDPEIVADLKDLDVRPHKIVE
jgi:hypothetical protein